MNPFDTRSITFAEPIDMLYACHSKVRRFCHQISLLPDYLAQHGCNPIALQTIQQIQQYFTLAAPLHHQDEEQDFFPLLLRYAPQAQDAIQQLQSQHHTLHQQWQKLAAEFTQLTNHTLTTLNAQIAHDFVAAYHAHLAIEEPLFELGKQHIPPHELTRIGKNMAQRRQA